MNELRKVREAEYLLGHLRAAEVARDDEAFAYELSAFLSAARSALLYALEESKLRGHPQWYELAIRGRPCLRFLSDERNTNIHWQPVSPIRIESVPPAERDVERGSTLVYYFLEWGGTATAVELCEQYLGEVQEVLAQGEADGILTRQWATLLSPVQLQRRRAEAEEVRAQSRRRRTTR